MARKSEAVKIMLEIIKHPMEKEFSFNAPIGQGEKRLHRVRVELSRLRNIAANHKITVKHFKLLEKEIKPHPDKPGVEIVTILKTAGSIGTLQEEITKALMDMGAVKQVEA